MPVADGFNSVSRDEVVTGGAFIELVSAIEVGCIAYCCLAAYLAKNPPPPAAGAEILGPDAAKAGLEPMPAPRLGFIARDEGMYSLPLTVGL